MSGDLALRPEHWTKENCSHGVVFDRDDAALLDDPNEVRKKYPRGWFTENHPCPYGCDYRGIYYASFEHYISGDW